MKERVFYISCVGEFWVDVAKSMQKTHEWEPLLWTGVAKEVVNDCPNEQYLRGQFPNCSFVDLVEFEKGRGVEAGSLPPTSDDISVLGSTWVEALIMCSRHDPDGESYSLLERQRHLQILWSQNDFLLKKLRPTVMFFPEIPHFPAEFLLYQMAKQMGVRTIVGYFTKFARGILLTEDIRERSWWKEMPLPRSSVARAVTTYLERNQKAYEPPEAEKNFVRRSGSSTPFSFTIEVVRKWFRQLRNGITQHHSMYKAPGQSFVESAQFFNRTDYLRLQWKLGLKALRLRKLYNNCTQSPALKESYVYFAPNYQPERTTCPDAGLNVDLVGVVKKLRAALPPEVLIYYKEHPRTFDPWSRGGLMRDEEYYAHLLAIPGVKLLPLSLDSFQLIDGALFCSTATGTVGIEAVLRGKKSLIFGNVWYEGLSGLVRVGEKESVAQCIENLLADSGPDQALNTQRLNLIWHLEGQYSHNFRALRIREMKQKDLSRYEAERDHMVKRLARFPFRDIDDFDADVMA